ncbi:hypothetical protein PHYPSEUDO_008556 [Phytophthora pseudosyringae]|uniref:Essential protein Yae1 N-terminal domain-containing protein n=1 Tax=Phytophthora pseudosyringae TaxID=221518 RepID=A0A8T1VEE7_9STRA|nr:hypothetical protein PHYPSEUDO_008556 [Phytophthora pseudosyringae]
MASDSDDDGFQDFLGEDEGEHETLLSQESAAMERRMKTLGIRDGLELGKEDALQEGFDRGFAQGAARSFRFARLRGALGAAAACGLLDADVMTQAKLCMSQLRTLEMDTSVHKDVMSNEMDTTAVRQAEKMLTRVGLDLSTSSAKQ